MILFLNKVMLHGAKHDQQIQHGSPKMIQHEPE